MTTLFAFATVSISGSDTVSVTKLDVALQETGEPALPWVARRVAPV